MRRALLLSSLCVLLFAADPWTGDDVLRPEQVASRISTTSTSGPLVIHVGFPVMYRATHITGSVFAGPGSTPQGIDDLKKEVAGQPRSREIIIYCGCCPWDKCPNVRPAFALLHDLGFLNLKVMQIPESFKTDWIDKGFPTEKHAEQ
jgi:thiosulfate/3-mercaptopyruvate sulfurtransferase